MEKPMASDVKADLVFIGRSNIIQPSETSAGLSGKIVVSPSSGLLSLGAELSDEDRAASFIGRGATGVILIPSAQVMQLWGRLSAYFDTDGQPTLPPRPGPNGQIAPVIYSGAALTKAIASALKKMRTIFDQRRARVASRNRSMLQSISRQRYRLNRQAGAECGRYPGGF